MLGDEAGPTCLCAIENCFLRNRCKNVLSLLPESTAHPAMVTNRDLGYLRAYLSRVNELEPGPWHTGSKQTDP